MKNLQLDVDSQPIPPLSFEEELSEDFSYFPEKEDIKEVFPNFEISQTTPEMLPHFMVVRNLEMQKLKALMDYIDSWVDRFDTPSRKEFLNSEHYQFYQWIMQKWQNQRTS